MSFEPFYGKPAPLSPGLECFFMLALVVPIYPTRPKWHLRTRRTRAIGEKRIHLGTVRCLRTMNCFKSDARLVRWRGQYRGRRVIARETLPPIGWKDI